MDNQNVTVNLSGIKFSLDAETQKRIVDEITQSVLATVNSSLSQLTGELKQIITSLGAQPSATLAVAPDVEAETKPKGRKAKVKVKVKEEKTAKKTSKKQAESAKKADTEEKKSAGAESKPLSARAAKADLESRINSDIKLYKGYQKYPDYINEMGFNTIFDLLAFKFTHDGAQYFQDQNFIENILNESRLKVFANNSKVKKYVLSKVKPKTSRVKKETPKEEDAVEPEISSLTPKSKFEKIDMSKTLKGFLRKKNIITINDALLYCNEVKLKDLLATNNVNRHSLDYQLVKFLCANGFESKPLDRFLRKVEGDRNAAKNPVKEELTPVETPQTQALAETDTAEEREIRSNRFHNLTEAEINALYSDINIYPFSDYMKDTVFKKNKVSSVFELLFWFCGITREYIMDQFQLEKHALLRLENVLIENGFIDPIGKLEPLSYTYKSKYYHYIRFYRNKIINNKLFLKKFNKNLTEEELDNLYMNIDGMGFSESTLKVLKYNKIGNAISLIVYVLYGCDTAFPGQFTGAVLEEIDKVIEANGLNKYKYHNYVNGLRGYYFRSSLYIQKRKMEQGEFTRQDGAPTEAETTE
jgi:hypothetical protein